MSQRRSRKRQHSPPGTLELDEIPPPKRDAGTQTLHVQPPQRDAGTQTLHVQPPQRDTGTQTLHVQPPERDAGTQTLPVQPPKRDAGTQTLPVQPPQRDAGTQTLPKDLVVFQNALKEVLACEIRCLAKDRCMGCEIDHPSQTEHFHLMADSEELVALYFQEAFANVMTDKEGDIKERVWYIMENSFEEDEKGLQRRKYLETDTFLTISASLQDKIKEELFFSNSW